MRHFYSIKWKINIGVLFLVLVVTSIIAFTTYHFTEDIIMRQVDEKNFIIYQSIQSTYMNAIKTLKKEVEFLASGQDIYQFIGTSDYYANKGKFSWLYSLLTEGNNNFMVGYKALEEAEFAYLTNSKGIVVGDTRVNNENEVDKYFGQQLPINQYQNISPEEVYVVDGKPVLLINQEITLNNSDKVLGYYVLAISLKRFAEKFEDINLSDLEIQLINKDGIFLYHPDSNMLGKKIRNDWISKEIGKGVVTESLKSDDTYHLLKKFEELESLFLLISYPALLIYKYVNRIRNVILSISLIGMMIIFAGGFFYVSFHLGSLNRFFIKFNDLEQGDITEKIYLTGKDIRKKDELGLLGKAFNKMINTLRGLIQGIERVSSDIFNTSQYLKISSAEVGKASSNITEIINDVAAGTEKQVESINNIDQKIKNLAGGVKKITHSNQDVEKLGREMKNAADVGQNELNNVVNQMKQIRLSINEVAVSISHLNSFSRGITEILNLIDSIAEQTNLLALNAAIEAARAGDAGRGFNVVAQEIRKLAVESMASSEKIRELIEKIKEETNKAATKMEKGIQDVEGGEKVVNVAQDGFKRISEKVNQVFSGINNTVKVINEVEKDSQDIVDYMTTINSISQRTYTSTQGVAASSQEQTAALEQISVKADELTSMSAKLDSLVKKFRLEY